MGLDIAEIMMDIEEEYDIQIDENLGAQLDGTVISIINMIHKQVENRGNSDYKLDKSLDALASNLLEVDDDHVFKGDELSSINASLALKLPKGLFARRKYHKRELLERFQGLHYPKYSVESIRYRVKLILSEHCSSYWPQDQDHLLLDLRIE